jgi:hypothetical protein
VGLPVNVSRPKAPSSTGLSKVQIRLEKGVALAKTKQYCRVHCKCNITPETENLLVKLQMFWAPTNEGQLTVVGSVRGLVVPG